MIRFLAHLFGLLFSNGRQSINKRLDEYCSEQPVVKRLEQYCRAKA